MRIITIAAGLLMLVVPLRAEPITISAAVSLKESLTQVIDEQSNSAGEKPTLNFGATGQLLAQIREGAPVDLFIAASDDQMEQAERMELVDPATRTPILGNALVLIVPSDSKLSITSFADLADARVKRLSIGQPKTVPAGMYATQALKHLKLDSAVADRIIYGSSVRQVLDYVIRGEVDAAVVYATDAIAAGEKVKVVATADASAHDPIRYVAAVVKAGRQTDAAKAFIQTLRAEPAQKIFHAAGFTSPPTTGPAKTTK